MRAVSRRALMCSGFSLALDSVAVAQSSAVVSPERFGAIGDGRSHPLSSRFATLAEARAVYPFAKSLDQEIDLCAWQAAILSSGRVRAAPGREYVFCRDEFWPVRDGRALSGDPSGFPHLFITQDRSRFLPCPGVVVIDGQGCTIRNGQLGIHHHRGSGEIRDVHFKDMISSTTPNPAAGPRARKAVHFLFRWFGLANWTFTRCRWSSPRLPRDADESLGWLRSRPLHGFTNENITFDRCRFDGRTEIDLWGGRNYRFLNCSRPFGGYDDGITAKTAGERDDRSHDGFTGDVDGVLISGGTWSGCDALFVAGSDMRWTTRNVRIENVVLDQVGSVWLLKPDGRGSARDSGGVVENVVAENVTLSDPAGARYTSAFQFTTGRARAGQRAGTVRNCRARNVRIVARGRGGNGWRHRVVTWNPLDGLGRIASIDIEVSYEDPWAGRLKGRGGARGEPLFELVGTDVNADRLAPDSAVDCRLLVHALRAPAPTGNRDRRWRVGRS